MTVAPRTESEFETCHILIHLLIQLTWKIFWHFNMNSTSRNKKPQDYLFLWCSNSKRLLYLMVGWYLKQYKNQNVLQTSKAVLSSSSWRSCRKTLCNLGRTTCVTWFLFKSRALWTESSAVDWIPWNQPKAIKPRMKARSRACIVSCRALVGT